MLRPAQPILVRGLTGAGERVAQAPRGAIVSYSHADEEWLDRLQVMAAPLVRKGLELWSDRGILAGQTWRTEIEQAIQRARVGLLLVSPDYLSSEFIVDDELQQLLAATRRGLRILWVPVRHSLVEHTVIAELQAAHDLRTPLEMLAPADQDLALKRIVLTLGAAVGIES